MRFGTPRLIVRTTAAMFSAILLTLAAVFVMLLVDARGRAIRVVSAELESAERLFTTLERQRARQTALQATVIADSAGLATALVSEGGTSHRGDSGGPAPLAQALDRLAGQLEVEALAIVDGQGLVVASGGPRRQGWPAGAPARADDSPTSGNGNERIVRRATGVFRVVALPIASTRERPLELQIATALDGGYAQSLAAVTRSDVVLTLHGDVLASTLQGDARQMLASRAALLPQLGLIDLGHEHAVRRVLSVGPVQFHAVASVDSASKAAGSALGVLALIATGALALGAAASLWLSRSVARPIDGVSQQIRFIAGARDFGRQLPPTGSSRELDHLTQTFNQLLTSLGAAEAKTELAYVGAIKALAAALDCRDPYTAGHSERVSALAVMIGRQMQLPPDQLEVLRLGALLHDIGKIGIRDNVLTKVGPLTAEEFEIIKTHPTLGARILREVAFLGPQLPIVELHHERPDGRGYPHGLLGHATPLLARIVHVADAFDAMTTARAYRPAQPVAHATAELWRYAGTQFDAEVVEAFVAARPVASVPEPDPAEALGAVAGVVAFARARDGRR
jgi:putative nucleotidyltransferase with HDIG domain